MTKFTSGVLQNEKTFGKSLNVQTRFCRKNSLSCNQTNIAFHQSINFKTDVGTVSKTSMNVHSSDVQWWENIVLHWFYRDKSGFFIKLRERAERGGEGKRMKIDYHSTADIKWIRPLQNQLKFKTQNKIFCSKSRFGIFVVKLLLCSKCRHKREPSDPRERVKISSVLC